MTKLMLSTKMVYLKASEISTIQIIHNFLSLDDKNKFLKISPMFYLVVLRNVTGISTSI